MKVKLSVKERIVLLNLMPKAGDFLFVKIVRQVMEDLSFSDDENKQLCFHQDLKGGLHWVEDAAEGINKEIDIPETIKEKIVSELMKLNEQKKLTVEQVELYEIFVKQ